MTKTTKKEKKLPRNMTENAKNSQKLWLKMTKIGQKLWVKMTKIDSNDKKVTFIKNRKSCLPRTTTYWLSGPRSNKLAVKNFTIWLFLSYVCFWNIMPLKASWLRFNENKSLLISLVRKIFIFRHNLTRSLRSLDSFIWRNKNIFLTRFDQAGFIFIKPSPGGF